MTQLENLKFVTIRKARPCHHCRLEMSKGTSAATWSESINNKARRITMHARCWSNSDYGVYPEYEPPEEEIYW